MFLKKREKTNNWYPVRIDQINKRERERNVGMNLDELDDFNLAEFL